MRAVWWLALLLVACQPDPVDVDALGAELRRHYGDRRHTITVVEKEEACAEPANPCPNLELFEKAGWVTLERRPDARVLVRLTAGGRSRARVDVESNLSYYRFDLSKWELASVDVPTAGTVLPRERRSLDVSYRFRYVALPNAVELAKFGWPHDPSARSSTTKFIRDDARSPWRIEPFREGGSHPAF